MNGSMLPYWIKSLLKSLIVNLPQLVPVFIVFFLVSLVGIVIYQSILKEEKWYNLVPAGMITGVVVLILYLGTLSHFLKGEFGILIIFLLYMLTGLFLFRKKGLKFKIKDKKKDIFVPLVLYLVLFTFIFVKAGNAVFGGDAITYWGLSTSFSNGNYPQVLPWQPDHLTVHHQGAFLFMGALHALSSTDIRVIHFVFVSFMIFAGFSLLWGYFYKKTERLFSSLMPSILGYLVFGGVYLLLPKFLFSENKIISLENAPTLQSAKNALGALTSMFDLYYLIPRTTALVVILLIFLTLVSKNNQLTQRLKLFVISSFSIVTLSIDESMFAAMLLPVVTLVIFKLKETKDKNKYFKDLLFAAIIFFSLFWIIGNPMRDSILTPSPEASRFKLVGISEIVEQGRVSFLRPAIFESPFSENFVWYLPHMSVLLLTIFLFAIYTNKKLLWLFLLTSVGSTLLYFMVDHTFWPANYPRFLLFSYQFYGFALGYLITHYLNKNKLNMKVFFSVMVVITLPSILVNFGVVAKSVPSDYYSNYAPITPKHSVLNWIDDNLKYNERVFFIDGFLHGKNYSEYALHGIQGYGLFIPISSAKYKMHTAEFGPEAIDVINTLSPSAIDSLGIEHIYILNDQLGNYSKDRQKQVENERYFSELFKDEKGVLYEIKNEYIEEIDEGSTIANLAIKLGKGKNIYLDPIPNIDYYTRAALFLALSDNTLYSEWGQGHYNYVEKFIKVKLPQTNVDYDYLIVNSETDIQNLCNCGDLMKIWEYNNLKVFENIKENEK